MLFLLPQKQMNFIIDRGFKQEYKHFFLVQKVLQRNEKVLELLSCHKKNDIHNHQEK
jgi:hypothetical protein